MGRQPCTEVAAPGSIPSILKNFLFLMLTALLKVEDRGLNCLSNPSSTKQSYDGTTKNGISKKTERFEPVTKPKRAPKLQKMTERHSTLTFMKMMQNAAVVIPRKQEDFILGQKNRISNPFGNANGGTVT